MVRFCRGVLATAFLVLFAPRAFSQDYSNSITATYGIAANVTYLKAGTWEAKLDIYKRLNVTGPQPTLIWIHGGDSMSGAKEIATFNLLPYLEWGWNVVNIEHRLPGVTLAPEAMQNCLCAVRWVVRNAKVYGFDIDKLVISGSSSGGWFALATAMAERPVGWDQPCPGTEQTTVAAVVNWYGNWDLADILQGENLKPYAAGWVRGLPNPLDIARRMLPIVRPSGPPVISIHGDADPIVPYNQSVRLHKALRDAGVAEQLITVPGGKHGGFTRSEHQRAYAAIEVFLAKQGIRPK